MQNEILNLLTLVFGLSMNFSSFPNYNDFYFGFINLPQGNLY